MHQVELQGNATLSFFLHTKKQLLMILLSIPRKFLVRKELIYVEPNAPVYLPYILLVKHKPIKMYFEE